MEYLADSCAKLYQGGQDGKSKMQINKKVIRVVSYQRKGTLLRGALTVRSSVISQHFARRKKGVKSVQKITKASV